jgi:hypothetical protein
VRRIRRLIEHAATGVPLETHASCATFAVAFA